MSQPQEREPVGGRPLTDATKTVIYGVVAVIVGLIGLGISGRFEPLQASPAGSSTAAPAVDTTTTTSTTLVGQLATTKTPPTGAAASSEPVEFSISVESVDFGDDATTREFEITNSGGQVGSYSVTASVESVLLAAGGGELAPGETLAFQVGLDREELPEGDFEATITVAWDGGERELAVTASHIDNPIIHNPQASPSQVQVDGDCPGGRTTVSARIRDTSEFTGVVRWSPDGGGTRETEMVHVGNEIYEAEIGPFTVVGTREARIVATDALGNAGGASVDITVTDCT